MQITPDDRPDTHTPSSGPRHTTGKLITFIIAICLLCGFGYYLFKQLSTVETTPEKIVVETTSPKTATTEPLEVKQPPEIPEQTIEEPILDVALPTLDGSDFDAKKQLDSLTAAGNLSNWFFPEHLIRRGVAFIDGLSHGAQLNKMYKVPSPTTKFLVVKEDKKLWLDTHNYQRYDYAIKVIDAIDNDQLVKSFHLFRPLLEEAYSELGYAAKDLDKAIISALNQILATPFRHEPIELTQESVHYKYANPKLEALTPIQKQLLRMGPENTYVIQKKAQILRNALLEKSN